MRGGGGSIDIPHLREGGGGSIGIPEPCQMREGEGEGKEGGEEVGSLLFLTLVKR